jgi:hypothetical protein
VTPLLIFVLSGCAAHKLLRLENQVLEREVTGLRADLDVCTEQAPSEDYMVNVSMDGVSKYIARAGFETQESTGHNVVRLAYEGENTSFHVNIQLFEREKVLFLVAAGYLRLEEATTSKSMVLLLTRLAAMNYDMLIGKIQLNPATGDITMSAEINVDDGMGYQTFSSVLQHLMTTADAQYPTLVQAARGLGP